VTTKTHIHLDLLSLFRSASRVAVLTGAGVSKESGVPTFRDAQTGLWAQYSPTDLATPEAFRRNPKRVWEWYAMRREMVSQAQPNPGHLALAEMEARLAERGAQCTLITQNVDSLHQRAGSQNVIELHGNLARTKCSAEDRVVTQWPPSEQAPPPCPHCGAPLRPDVVWFGEDLPMAAILAAKRAARESDIFLSVGTSGLVEPAASLPFTALQRRAVVVEINPDLTPLTPEATYVLAGPSGEVLPALVSAAWPPQAPSRQS
jgi:NAD-dependent deacetylase